MADDHNALLARADYWLDHFEMRELGDDIDADLIADLVAELRALTSRHHTALGIIRDAIDWWDDDTRGGTVEMDALRAVLDQAKDPHP